MRLRTVIVATTVILCSFGMAGNVVNIPTNVLVAHESVKYSQSELIVAIAKVESNNRQFAVSSKGARGVTQIMPKVWSKELKDNGIIKDDVELFDVSKNIKACSYILNVLRKQHGNNLEKMLQHYSGRAVNYYNKVRKEMARSKHKTFYNSNR